MPGYRPSSGHVDSYLICTTPRTGSTLLCGLLASTTVAGQPESYFREPDEQLWATRWDLARSSDGGFERSDFIRAALAAGRTDNGVFAARIMWGTLDHLFDRLRSVHSAPAEGDLELLHLAFGPTRFVYLRRDDVLAQAVSWHRAEQTNVWHSTDHEEVKQREREPRFDFDEIRDLVQTIDEHNSAWQAWFASVGIQPHEVRYEDLDADPVGVTREVLDFLGLKLPPGRQIRPRNRRLADELNARWIDRYGAELAATPGRPSSAGTWPSRRRPARRCGSWHRRSKRSAVRSARSWCRSTSGCRVPLLSQTSSNIQRNRSLER